MLGLSAYDGDNTTEYRSFKFCGIFVCKSKLMTDDNRKI